MPEHAEKKCGGGKAEEKYDFFVLTAPLTFSSEPGIRNPDGGYPLISVPSRMRMVNFANHIIRENNCIY